MNYKHLGKYHYIYRLSFGGDGGTHIEKFPIAYSNQHYVYVILPGSYELKQLSLRSFDGYSACDIFTEAGDKVREKIVRWLGEIVNSGYKVFRREYYFLIDNPEELKQMVDQIDHVDLVKAYLMSQANDIRRTIDHQEKETQKWRSKLANLNYRIYKHEHPDE